MRILIAEDEEMTARALKVLLEREKFSVDVVHNGNDAWEYAKANPYEVAILDIMMPGMSGLDVLCRIREARLTTSVLMLTAKSGLEDRVAGLNAGADDYLPKPFASSELIARVKALCRRSETYAESVMEVGNLTLDLNRFEMSVGERYERLNNKEFQLMELFATHPGFVFSTEHLYQKIWGLDAASDINVVWTHIGFVRKKLRNLQANVEIKTIRGAGYTLAVSPC